MWPGLLQQLLQTVDEHPLASRFKGHTWLLSKAVLLLGLVVCSNCNTFDKNLSLRAAWSFVQCAANLIACPACPFASLALPTVQNIRKRLHKHRKRSNFGPLLVAWYVVLPSSVNRETAQGHMITAADKMGLPMSSVNDASMGRRKGPASGR